MSAILEFCKNNYFMCPQINCLPVTVLYKDTTPLIITTNNFLPCVISLLPYMEFLELLNKHSANYWELKNFLITNSSSFSKQFNFKLFYTFSNFIDYKACHKNLNNINFYKYTTTFSLVKYCNFIYSVDSTVYMLNRKSVQCFLKLIIDFNEIKFVFDKQFNKALFNKLTHPLIKVKCILNGLPCTVLFPITTTKHTVELYVNMINIWLTSGTLNEDLGNQFANGNIVICQPNIPEDLLIPRINVNINAQQELIKNITINKWLLLNHRLYFNCFVECADMHKWFLFYKNNEPIHLFSLPLTREYCGFGTICFKN